MTLRDLVWMAQGRQKEAWGRTSVLLALLANAHRDPKKKPAPFTPDDFNPFRRKRRPDFMLKKKDFGFLKNVFVEGGK